MPSPVTEWRDPSECTRRIYVVIDYVHCVLPPEVVKTEARAPADCDMTRLTDKEPTDALPTDGLFIPVEDGVLARPRAAAAKRYVDKTAPGWRRKGRAGPGRRQLGLLIERSGATKSSFSIRSSVSEGLRSRRGRVSLGPANMNSLSERITKASPRRVRRIRSLLQRPLTE